MGLRIHRATRTTSPPSQSTGQSPSAPPRSRPDPSKVGDRVERFCDPSIPACVDRSPLLRTIKRHVPTLGVRGGLALRRQDANAWWITNGSAARSTGVDRVEARYHHDRLIVQRRAPPEYNVHACDVICAKSTRNGLECEPAEGTALAWEVLRSAGLVECPAWWKRCDDLDEVDATREPWRKQLSQVPLREESREQRTEE